MIGFNMVYIKHATEGYTTLAPWFDEPFNSLYEKIKDYTVVSRDRCYIIDQLSKHSVLLKGAFAECGVYKGGTAYILKENILLGKNLYLFDTFEGMPITVVADPSKHKVGDFGDTSVNNVKAFLGESKNIKYEVGTIPKTFESLPEEEYAFVHIDVDLFAPALVSCEYFYPKMVDGGIILFDDYGFEKYKNAEKAAVDEFFRHKNENVIVLPTGQAFIIKVRG
jgi:hypothetical protein